MNADPHRADKMIYRVVFIGVYLRSSAV